MNAIIVMLTSVLLYALYPVAIVEADAEGYAALDQLIGIYVFASIALVAALGLYGGFGVALFQMRKLVTSPRLMGLAVLDSATNAVAFYLLVRGLEGASKLQAAILYETWPVAFLIFTLTLRAGRPGGFRVTGHWGWSLLFFAVGLVGLLLVASSDLTALGALASPDALGEVPPGVWFGLGSALFMALSTLFATDISRALKDAALARSADAGELGASVRASIASSLISRVISLGVAAAVVLVAPDAAPQAAVSTGAIWSVSLVFALPGLIAGLGGVTFIAANNLSAFSNVNLLWYFTPLFAAAFLAGLGYETDVAGSVFLGAVFIVVANFGLNLEREFGLGFRAALAALSVFAAVSFFVPGYAYEGHFEATALVTAFFAITVAFLIDRQNRRRNDIEDLLSALLIENLKIGDARIAAYVMGAAQATGGPAQSARAQEIYEAYETARPEIAKAVLDVARAQARRIQFGEMFSLFMLASSLIIVAILGRPDSVLADFIAIVVPTTAVHLTVSALALDEVRVGADPEAPERELFSAEHVRQKIFNAGICGFFTVVLFGFSLTALLLKAG